MTDSVQVFPPGFRLVDPTGVPYSGGYARFYVAGTTEEKLVYSDDDLTSSLGSTVYTDSAGAFVAASGSTSKVLIYVGTDPYKIVLYTSADVQIGSFDNVSGAVTAGSGGGGGSGISQAAADARYMRNPNALVAVSAIDDADYVGFWDTSGSANVAITWANLKANLENEGVILEEGTVALLYQSTAPTGWTRVTTAGLDNIALRLVTTGGGTTGGTSSFTSVFTDRTITQANLPSFTLPDTLAISNGASVTHSLAETRDTKGTAAGSVNVVTDVSFGNSTVGLTGSVTSGGSGTAISFAVAYADIGLYQKDAL